MNTNSYKTISANFKTVDKKWVLIDVKDQTLGRVASRVASIIRGKHKSNFTPHVDCGDNVVIVNAGQVRLTGDKFNSKKYITYSGYQGGQKEILAKDMLRKKPIFIVENAVRGMLPKNKLGRALFKNLFVYEGENHNNQAQQPKELKV